MTKRLDCRAVISEEVCKMAGIPADALTRAEVEIRGHEKPMSVRTTDDPTVLAGLLDSRQAAAAEQPLSWPALSRPSTSYLLHD